MLRCGCGAPHPCGEQALSKCVWQTQRGSDAEVLSTATQSLPLTLTHCNQTAPHTSPSVPSVTFPHPPCQTLP